MEKESIEISATRNPIHRMSFFWGVYFLRDHAFPQQAGTPDPQMTAVADRMPAGFQMPPQGCFHFQREGRRRFPLMVTVQIGLPSRPPHPDRIALQPVGAVQTGTKAELYWSFPEPALSDKNWENRPAAFPGRKLREKSSRQRTGRPEILSDIATCIPWS